MRLFTTACSTSHAITATDTFNRDAASLYQQFLRKTCPLNVLFSQSCAGPAHDWENHRIRLHLHAYTRHRLLQWTRMGEMCWPCTAATPKMSSSFVSAIPGTHCDIPNAPMKNTKPGKELKGHIEHNSEQLAELLASKERLRDRMGAARTDMNQLRGQITENRRDFEAQLERLRKQVAPLVPASHSTSKSPSAPPSTPAG